MSLNRQSVNFDDDFIELLQRTDGRRLSTARVQTALTAADGRSLCHSLNVGARRNSAICFLFVPHWWHSAAVTTWSNSTVAVAHSKTASHFEAWSVNVSNAFQGRVSCPCFIQCRAVLSR
jgi:hypothetical protein